jgi:hypothetical protein
LETEQITGLFLEGETKLLPGWMQPQPVERAGAVLSARNKADLQEASRLIQSVVDRATPMDEDPMMPKDEKKKPMMETATAEMLQAILNKLPSK